MHTTIRIAAVTTATLAFAATGLTTAVTTAAATDCGSGEGVDSCSGNVPASLDPGIWTHDDGAPRYLIDGIGFSEGKVRVQVTTKAGRVLWTRTVQTGYDPGLPEPTFHVGTSVKCDHRTRYARALDVHTRQWTERYVLNPCIL